MQADPVSWQRATERPTANFVFRKINGGHHKNQHIVHGNGNRRG